MLLLHPECKINYPSLIEAKDFCMLLCYCLLQCREFSTSQSYRFRLKMLTSILVMHVMKQLKIYLIKTCAH